MRERLDGLTRRIELAARTAGRDPAEVRLLAVSKQQPAEAIRAAVDAGQREFGESYVQEALSKMAELGDLGLTWHFIGRLQANKTRAVAEHFAWVHTVDRARIADRLGAQRPFHAPPLNVCIQVQIEPEEQKAGVPPAEVETLARHIQSIARLKYRGLMCIPPPAPSRDAQRAVFGRLADLARRLDAAGIHGDTLSMGMSDDFESAIAAGSTLVRIGTALFGERA